MGDCTSLPLPGDFARAFMVQCDVNQEKITIPETQRRGYLLYVDEDTGKSRDHE